MHYNIFILIFLIFLVFLTTRYNGDGQVSNRWDEWGLVTVDVAGVAFLLENDQMMNMRTRIFIYF